MLIQSTPQNAEFARALTRKFNAEAGQFSARAALARAAGCALVLIGAGAGVALGMIGWGFARSGDGAGQNPMIVVIPDRGTGGDPSSSSAAREVTRPSRTQLQAGVVPPSKAKLVVNYTIFHTADIAGGEVQTGWDYSDSNQQMPSRQYCLLVQHAPGQANTFVKIGADGRMVLPNNPPAGIDLAGAYSNCVWASTETGPVN